MKSAFNWNEGAPPDMHGKDKVWIVAEIPVRLTKNIIMKNIFGFRCFLWLGLKGWTDKEVIRATRWAFLPMPEQEDEAP